MDVYLWTHTAFLELFLHLSSFCFSKDNMKLCSHTSEASVLHLLWTFSILTGRRSWICFLLSLLKGQGNMKPQKANSSLCHISVSPQGNIAVVFLMLFLPPLTFQSTVLGTTGDSSHSNTLTLASFLLSCFWWILGAPEGVQHTCDEQGEDITRLGLIAGILVLVLHGHNRQFLAHTCLVIVTL